LEAFGIIDVDKIDPTFSKPVFAQWLVDPHSVLVSIGRWGDSKHFELKIEFKVFESR
jgi:hypothetical protein